MDRVEDWIGGFYTRHTERCPREDWPEPNTEAESSFMGAWKHSFVTKGVEFRFADVASLDMAGDPPSFLDQHLPTLVKLALDLRRREDAEARTGAEPVGLDAARLASRDCPDCLGNGFATRFLHPDHFGRLTSRSGHLLPVGTRLALHCACPLGVHLHQEDRQAPPERRLKIPSLGQFPEWLIGPVDWSDGLDNSTRFHPAGWDFANDRPAGDLVTIRTPAELKLFCDSLAASKHSEGPILPGRFREPHGYDARAVPARSELAGAIPDPIIAAELRSGATVEPAKAQEIHLPEDDLGLF